MNIYKAILIYLIFIASGSGIYKHDAQSAPPGVKLRESYPMGTFKGNSKDIENIILQLHPKFQGSDYHVINNNCNAFADEFLKKLLGIGSPAYVNRMAFYGSFFTCFMPDSYNQDPTQVNNNSNHNNSNNNSNNNMNRNPSYSINSQSGNRLGTNSSSNSTEINTTKEVEDSAAIRQEKIRQATLNRQYSTVN